MSNAVGNAASNWHIGSTAEPAFCHDRLLAVAADPLEVQEYQPMVVET
jgi:hypothetical protein